MFSPTLGRWVQNDPIEYEADDPNLYRFVSNNPPNFTDPSGLDPQIGPRGEPGVGGFRGGLGVMPKPPAPPQSIPSQPPVPGAVPWRGGWLLPCPKTIDELKALPLQPDYKGKVSVWKDPAWVTRRYHAGATETWRIRIDGEPVDNQCGYDCNGRVITAGTGAGTADSNNANPLGHFLMDVLPWELTPHGKIDDYHKHRPPITVPDAPANRVDVIPPPRPYEPKGEPGMGGFKGGQGIQGM